MESAEAMPDLDELVSVAGTSRVHFHRMFKSVTGVTPKDYA
jgi:AraC family transcriptional regulator of adaptative response/methylated-DNA-[protein]-cysteine methyltransferase